MLLRRTTMATAACTLALAALPTATAAAAAGTAARAALTCKGGVIGFSQDGHLVNRGVTNKKVIADNLSTNTVAFNPTGFTFQGGTQVDGGFEQLMTTINTDGQARTIRVLYGPDNGPATITSVANMRNRNFDGRLLAGSGSSKDFILDKAGTLKLYQTYAETTGRLFWAKPVVVRRNLGGLTSLVFFGRLTVDGVKKDILWATTRHGALLQLQVPARQVTKAKVIVVKKRGFKNVTGISPSACNKTATIGSLVALQGTKNQAHFYTIKNQTHPLASNLVDHGLFPAGNDWNITPVM
jgi:hypothetical protein